MGKEVDEILEGHLRASSRVRGIRQEIFWHPSKRVLNSSKLPSVVLDPEWRRGFEQLGKYALSFETACSAHQIDELTQLAQAYPETKIILCHLGVPVGIGGPFGDVGRSADERKSILERWRESLTKLARKPNVYVKLSGLGMPVFGFGYEHGKQKPEISEVTAAFAPLINFAIDTFGAKRCMFGSNYPIDKVSLSFSTLYEAYLGTVSNRSPEEIKYLLGQTAKNAYGIES